MYPRFLRAGRTRVVHAAISDVACIERLEPRRLLSQYGVAPWGDDSADGSLASPWKTLQSAANAVEAGDIVTVRPGEYAGFNLGWERVHAGTPDAPILFQADPGALITSAGTGSTDAISIQDGSDYVIIQGFTIRNTTGTILHAGIRVAASDHVTIRNNTVDQCGWWGIFTSFAYDVLIENNTVSRSGYQHGIYVSNSGDRPVIRGNTVFANRMAGIHMNGDLSAGGDGLISGALVEYNILYDNGLAGGAAINADGVQDSVFRHNLVYNNHAGGLTLYAVDSADGSRRNLVYNNTIIQSPNSRWTVKIENYSTGNTLYNNILYNYNTARGTLNVSPDSLPGFFSDYNIVDGRFTPNDENVIDIIEWNATTNQDRHSIIANPTDLFVNPAAADFHLKPNSPAIDAGNPATYYLREPLPNGGRVDIGAYGNTPEATPSPLQSIQILSPGSGEKVEQGDLITVAWQSAGLTTVRPIALINAGSSTNVGRWLADAYRAAPASSAAFSNPVDTSAVADPAPSSVYQTYASVAPGPGQRLAWSLPVPDGDYTLRLHFVDPQYDSPGSRRFDINLQNTTVASAFDIAASAGAARKAITADYTVQAVANRGIHLELVNLTSNPAIISAIELIQEESGGVPSPAVNVELSTDNGQTWKLLGAGPLMDRFGDGIFSWNASAISDSALFRIAPSQLPLPPAVSNWPLLIANNGPDFYINDLYRTADVFTTAAGYDSNSGKTPNSPMATLSALLGAYHLEPGDVIHVDSGMYNLLTNIIIDADDAGVRIEGPTTQMARISRKSVYRGDYAFELRNADNITLDHLSIVVAEIGIYASDSSDSDDLTISNCRVYANRRYGIRIGSSNDRPTISNSTLYALPDDGPGEYQAISLSVAAPNAIITGNTVYDSAQDGIRVTGPNATVANNTVYGNGGTGIYVAAGSVTNNTVYDNLIGIALTSNAVAANNTVYNNYDGIVTADSAGPGPYSLWTDSTVTTGAHDPDPQPVEVGVKFAADIDGFISAIRFHKISLSTGVHLAHLWTRDGQLLAAATFFDGDDEGWQTVYFDNPVPVSANTTYIASYYSPNGGYLLESWFFSVLGVDNGPLHALANGDDGSNGVFLYADGGGFPTEPFEAGNYWVDVVFNPATSRTPPQTNSATVTSNTVYNNTHAGILAYNDSTLANNTVHSNSIGLDLVSFTGRANSNLVYANTAYAIQLTSADSAHLINNTLYQPTGDAIRITAASNNLTLRNNILSASAGYAIHVAPDSQTGFTSDHNLFDFPKYVGFWNGADQPSLLDWQSASSTDPHSRADDPRFIHPHGNDGILGTPDDNFHLVAHSIAIDHADSSSAPASDIHGLPRLDDPGTPNSTTGFADIGACEFPGNSNAATPPAITAIDPPFIFASSFASTPPSRITLIFSQPLDPIDASAPSTYRLISTGPDALFNTPDDIAYPLTPIYTLSSTSVQLDIPTTLPIGLYRLTVFGNPDQSLHDLSGLRLDGDFVRQFAIEPPPVNGTPADDRFLIRIDPANPKIVQIFLNTTITSPPIRILPLDSAYSLTFNAVAGNDRFAIDFTYGSPIPAGALHFIGSNNTGDLVLIGSNTQTALYTPSRTIAGNSEIFINNHLIDFQGLASLSVYSFSSFTLVTPNPADSLTIDRPDSGQTRVAGSSGNVPLTTLKLFTTPILTIDAASNDNSAAADAITIGPGDLSANGITLLMLDTGDGNNTLTVRNATVNLQPIRSPDPLLVAATPPLAPIFASIDITGPARLKLNPGGNNTLRTRSLTISPEGRLDLADNALIVQSDPANHQTTLAWLAQQIRHAWHTTPPWSGPGITSSTVPTRPYTSLAVVPNNNRDGQPLRSTFAGQPVDANSILLRATYDGDANLDGVVNADDYFQIDSGFISQSTGYHNGDFNHDTVINADDYFLIDSAFIAQSAPRSHPDTPTPPHSDTSFSVSPVPRFPVSFSLLDDLLTSPRA